MTKRAFVVGIDDYDNWNSAGPLAFPRLKYCAADATAFAMLLTTSFGFGPDDVILCENAEATLQSILGGLTNLLSPSQPGDVICFYFAGMGGRVPENGWGVRSARYYDAIVPSDGAGMLMDYQLVALAQSLLPPGVNLTIVMDTCHSGASASDAVVRFRGFGWSADLIGAFISNCRTVIPFAGWPDPSVLDGNISNPLRADQRVTMTTDATKDSSAQARALLLSACNYGEMAAESNNQSHGYLTNALLELANQPDFQMNPAALLQGLRQKVSGYSAGQQTPQLRGRPVGTQDVFLG
ncbi:MAG: caspase family protein [Anaerolineae bacterium]